MKPPEKNLLYYKNNLEMSLHGPGIPKLSLRVALQAEEFLIPITKDSNLGQI